MRNTCIPLDMLFIGSDRRVRNIARRTTPLSERTIESAGPVRYVLEMNKGWFSKKGIKAGTKLSGPVFAK